MGAELDEGSMLRGLRRELGSPSEIVQIAADAILDQGQRDFSALTATTRPYARVQATPGGAEIQLTPEAQRALFGVWQSQPSRRQEATRLLGLDVVGEDFEEDLGRALDQRLTRDSR